MAMTHRERLEAVRMEVKLELSLRLHEILEWYLHGDCVWCAETERNIKRDVQWLLDDVAKKHGLRKIPMRFSVACDQTGYITVKWHENWDTN